MTINPLLLFHNHLRQSPYLLLGRLLLINKSDNTIVEEFIATSGCPGWQYPAGTRMKGKGAIPEQSDCKILNYTIDTAPIAMPHTKGIEGNFYKIEPFAVSMDGGFNRGDFGVHADRNVPGSAGCVVLTTDVGWKVFQQQMQKMLGQGIYQVPLLISYSKG